MPDSTENLWRLNVNNDAASFHRLVGMSPFKDWDICTAPECLADAELMYATENLFAGDPFGYAKRFLQKSVAVCNRIIAEQRWQVDLCRDSFPLNRGETYRIKAYATGLLEGGWNVEWLSQAAGDFVEYTKGMGWQNEVIQNWYLTAVLVAFFAGDKDQARALLARKRSYSHHVTLHGLLVEILEPKVVLPISRETELFGRFQSYFDQARGPEHTLFECTDIWNKRIELSVLRQMAFEDIRGRIDWLRVVGAIIE